jgi:hypothetical protein
MLLIPAACRVWRAPRRSSTIKRTYYGAKDAIGFRPSYVADQIACFGRGLQENGESLGMKIAIPGAAKGDRAAGERRSRSDEVISMACAAHRVPK